MMSTDNPILIARGLIERHGLRAVALAEERREEARLSGDTAALEHWSAVAAAAAELRRTGRRKVQPTVH
jgi:hypothetical protein